MTFDASLGLSTMIKTVPRNLSPKPVDSKFWIDSSTSFNSFLVSSILIGALPHNFPGIFAFGKPFGSFSAPRSSLYLSSLYSGSGFSSSFLR